jgi:hypothetical protein
LTVREQALIFFVAEYRVPLPRPRDPQHDEVMDDSSSDWILILSYRNTSGSHGTFSG